jgi:hypothetical protein
MTVLQWAAHHLSFHLLLYTAVILLLLYKPPANVMTHLQGLGDFVSRHWGDSIGLYMIHLGILLDVLAGVYPSLADIGHVGESFILTGVGMLKLKYNPKETTNGNGTITEPPVTPPVVTSGGGVSFNAVTGANQ